MLGNFFGIAQQVLFIGEVFCWCFAAQARAGDRADDDIVAFTADEDFRRRADNMEIAKIVVEHIRRWVQRTQGAVEGKRIVGKFHAHALAGDNLHAVACKDVVFDFVDAGFERFFAELADCLGLFAAEREWDGATLA